MEDYEDDTEDLTTNDWDIVAQNRKKDGFREGVTAGHEDKLQEGFNKGFEKGLKRSLPVGFVCGVLSGIQALSQSHGIPDLTDTDKHTIEDILQMIQHLKDENVEKLCLSLESNQDATSSLDEGLENEVTDCTIGRTDTEILESQSDELGAEARRQCGGDVYQRQSGDDSQQPEDSQNTYLKILHNYKKLLRDLNLEEFLQSLTSVS